MRACYVACRECGRSQLSRLGGWRRSAVYRQVGHVRGVSGWCCSTPPRQQRGQAELGSAFHGRRECSRRSVQTVPRAQTGRDRTGRTYSSRRQQLARAGGWRCGRAASGAVVESHCNHVEPDAGKPDGVRSRIRKGGSTLTQATSEMADQTKNHHPNELVFSAFSSVYCPCHRFQKSAVRIVPVATPRRFCSV
jgi:hypothetical protein